MRRPARQNVPARGTLVRNGQKVGKLTTQMKYLDADDAFQFGPGGTFTPIVGNWDGL